jgi:phosphoribosyl-ATP pyrophosphohydrolase
MSSPQDTLLQLFATLVARKSAAPETSYAASLYTKGPDAILKKIGEEAAEVLLAAKNLERGGTHGELVHELADLWFHTLVLLAAYDLPLHSLTQELERRMGRSGLDEKAARAAGEH